MAKGLLRQLQATDARVADMSVKTTVVYGSHLVQLPGDAAEGEARLLVSFGVWFCEMPHFTYGVVMGQDFVVEDEAFPQHAAVVSKWDIRRKAITGGFTGYYLGAEICFRYSGVAGQQVWVNWRMEAKALKNPVLVGESQRTGGDV